MELENIENGLSRTRKIILYHQVLDSYEMVLFHPNILEYRQLFQTILWQKEVKSSLSNETYKLSPPNKMEQ